MGDGVFKVRLKIASWLLANVFFEHIGDGIGTGHNGVSLFPGKGLDLRYHFMDGFNILKHIVQRPDLELGVLVHRTKGAFVPGTVPYHPDQQAPGFTGGPDGAAFKVKI